MWARTRRLEGWAAFGFPPEARRYAADLAAAHGLDPGAVLAEGRTVLGRARADGAVAAWAGREAGRDPSALLAEADAAAGSGGDIGIGDFNSGGNSGGGIAVGDAGSADTVVYDKYGKPVHVEGSDGAVAIDGGDVTISTSLDLSADGGVAIADASGGDGNFAFVS